MDNDGQEALVQMVEIISDIWMDSFSYCYDVLKEDSIAEACAESVTRIIVEC